MNELVKKYVELGVHQNKIVTTNQPSVVIWSKSRGCIVGGDGGIEIIEDGSKKLTIENNTLVDMLVRTELTNSDIDEINNSDGIICTNYDGFRYGFIPKSVSEDKTNDSNFEKEIDRIAEEIWKIELELDTIGGDDRGDPELTKAFKGAMMYEYSKAIKYVIDKGYLVTKS